MSPFQPVRTLSSKAGRGLRFRSSSKRALERARLSSTASTPMLSSFARTSAERVTWSTFFGPLGTWASPGCRQFPVSETS